MVQKLRLVPQASIQVVCPAILWIITQHKTRPNESAHTHKHTYTYTFLLYILAQTILAHARRRRVDSSVVDRLNARLRDVIWPRMHQNIFNKNEKLTKPRDTYLLNPHGTRVRVNVRGASVCVCAR